MKYRKLRIAWSLVWVVVAALLARIANGEFDRVHDFPIYSPKWLIVPLPLAIGTLP